MNKIPRCIFAGLSAYLLLFNLELLIAQTDPLFNKQIGTGSMSARWELDSSTRRGTFLVTPYKPVFITAGRWTDHPNNQPVSENPAYSLPFKTNYNNYEAKFQLSLKTKIFQGIFKSKGDLWIAYTQKAHWQIYNKDLSRPFRELNYEPEIILNFASDFPFLGFRTRMFGVSLNHQSNGRALPLSRSWNRVIFHAGFERKAWQVYIRPWLRLPDEEDENPGITNYVGRGEIVVIRALGKHQLSIVGAHSLNFHQNHGSILASWVFPVIGNFKLQLQVSDGYGETLVDYNFRQTTIGVSASLLEW